jgi:hypothetical protein
VIIDESLIGRKVIVQISKNHDPEVWKIHAIRVCEFGKFVAFLTYDNMEIATKISSLYSIKFVSDGSQ